MIKYFGHGAFSGKIMFVRIRLDYVKLRLTLSHRVKRGIGIELEPPAGT